MTSSRYLLVVPLAAACLALAGCGSTSTVASASSGGTASTTTTKAASSGRGAYRACLATHGVKLPQRSTAAPSGTGTGGAGFVGGGGFGNGQAPAGVDPTVFAKAQSACGGLRPQRTAASSQALAAFRSCMADHGVTLPVQRTGTAGSTATSTSGVTPPVTVDRTSPAYVAANQICRPLMGTAGTGPSASGGASPSTTAAK